MTKGCCVVSFSFVSNPVTRPPRVHHRIVDHRIAVPVVGSLGKSPYGRPADHVPARGPSTSINLGRRLGRLSRWWWWWWWWLVVVVVVVHGPFLDGFATHFIAPLGVLVSSSLSLTRCYLTPSLSVRRRVSPFFRFSHVALSFFRSYLSVSPSLAPSTSFSGFHALSPSLFLGFSPSVPPARIPRTLSFAGLVRLPPTPRSPTPPPV